MSRPPNARPPHIDVRPLTRLASRSLRRWVRTVGRVLPPLTRPGPRKAGLPPGSMVFTGERKVEETRIRIVEYDEALLEEHEVATPEETFPFYDQPSMSWVNIDGLHEVGAIRTVGEYFGVHPLVLEDIVNVGQRPKLEEFDDQLYFVLKMLSYDEAANALRIEQVSIVAGPTWVLTFQEEAGDVFDALRQRLQNAQSRVRLHGAGFLAYALVDIIVDHYFVILETVSSSIEELDEHVMRDPHPDLQIAIRSLHRELIVIRKAVWPVRELLAKLERSESALVTPELRPFVRDVYDHGIQAIDIIESLRDVLSGVRDSYQAGLGNRMNEIMKVLTIIGTVFIPLTFIAGVYGMNFDLMPELRWRYGYPVTLGFMLAVATGLLLWFRRRGWL